MEGSGTPPMTASLARRMHVSVQAASEMVEPPVRRRPGRGAAGPHAGADADGWRAADTIFHRHALMEWLLTRVVGLGWAESDEEAMRLQGAISPRVEEAIDDLLGHPHDLPPRQSHGRRDGPRATGGIPLSEVASGSDITILRITEEAEEDAELLVYLEEQGLVPGVRAHVTAGLEVARLGDHRGSARPEQHGPPAGIPDPGAARRGRPVAVPPGPGGRGAPRALKRPFGGARWTFTL